jgi:hypothetical protein
MPILVADPYAVAWSEGTKLVHSIVLVPNGLRYWRWGGHGLCLRAEKTRSQKNP